MKAGRLPANVSPPHPAIHCITRSCVASAAIQHSRHAAIAHDDQPGAEIEDLRQFRGNHQNGQPGRRQLVNQPVNLRFGADVHAARWFIQNQDAALPGQPFCENQFLLVAAGKRLRRNLREAAFTWSFSKKWRSHFFLRRRMIPFRLRRSKEASVMFSPHSMPRTNPWPLAILAHKSDAQRHRFDAENARILRVSIHKNPAGHARIQAENPQAISLRPTQPTPPCPAPRRSRSKN
jgi:hypothetical protein